MARGQLLNSIPDLQTEWATKHHTLSVRSFLIEHKGFTARQYRYIIGKAKLNQWHIRREEIQNQVVSAKTNGIVNRIVKSHEQVLKTANLNLLQINNQLTKFNPSTGKSMDLLNYARAMSVIQNTEMIACGISAEGLKTILESRDDINPLNPQPTISDDFEKSKKAAARLDYDDIVDLLKERRRKQRELAALTQKTEDKP